MQSKKNDLYNELTTLQIDIDLFQRANNNYSKLSQDLAGMEYLMPIFEPSARRLKELTEENIHCQIASMAIESKEKISKIDTFANLSNADTLDMRIQTSSDVPTGVISMALLGKFLQQVQSLVYSVIDPTKAKTKSNVKDFASLFVTAFAPGSFIVRAQEKVQPLKLFDKHAISASWPTIQKLMEAGDNLEELKDTVQDIDIIITSRYYSMLKTLSSEDCSITFEWASPYGDKHSSSLTSLQIRNIITIFDEDKELNSRQIRVFGRLTMIQKDDNNKRGRFKLISSEGITYQGTADESFLGFYVPSTVLAVLEEKIEINPTTDEEKISYHLLRVQKEDD